MIPSQLPIFIDVVRQGSFSSASRKLGVSPAAVSKSISQLEKLLNQRLFHRSTHSLTLTEEGRTLFDRTAELVEALDESVSLSMESSTEMEGKMKINLPVHFGQTLIYPKLLEFLKLYPKIEMDLHFDDKSVDLIEHGFDLGIGNRINDDSRLIARACFHMELIYVCSESYAETNGVPKTPDELEAHECITFRSPSTGRVVPWSFQKQGDLLQVSPKHRLVVNNPNSAFLAAKAGFGITCIGEYYLEQSPEGLITVMDEFKLPASPVWLYYSSRRYLPARVRTLIDFLSAD